jgi:hypothetical protein
MFRGLELVFADHPQGVFSRTAHSSQVECSHRTIRIVRINYCKRVCKEVVSGGQRVTLGRVSPSTGSFPDETPKPNHHDHSIQSQATPNIGYLTAMKFAALNPHIQVGSRRLFLLRCKRTSQPNVPAEKLETLCGLPKYSR